MPAGFGEGAGFSSVSHRARPEPRRLAARSDSVEENAREAARLGKRKHNNQSPGLPQFVIARPSPITAFRPVRRAQDSGGVMAVLADFRGSQPLSFREDSLFGDDSLFRTLPSPNPTNSAKTERVLGALRDLKGVVSRLYPNQNKAHIRTGRRYVEVEEHLFSTLRYESETGDEVSFRGFPVYRLGSSVEAFREFEAQSVTVPKQT